jgi:hypothetical protein
LFQYSSGSNLGELSNMMYFINYEIDQANVDKLYNYGSPLMSTATLTQAPNAWYKLDASEIYNSSTTEWEINEATADYTSSLSFPGVVGDLLKIPNSSTFVPTSNLTFSFWVNHTLPTGPTARDPRVFSVPKDASAESVYLMDNTNGTLRFTISSSAGNSDTSTAIAVNDGKWHNVVCTWDASGNIKVYTDNGTPSINAFGNTGTLTIPTSTDMGIGGKFTGTSSAEKFTGFISNGSVWNKALSASEVSEVYNSGQPGNLSSHSASSNLVAWWKMDNLTTGIQDSSTNSNNGTAFDLSVQPGSVSTLNGESSGMSQSNLVQSDLQTVAPYSKYAMTFDGTDYIDLNRPSALNFTPSVDAFSISAWINISSGNTGCIYSFGAGPNTSNTATQIKIGVAGGGSAGKIQAVIGGSETYSTNTVDESNWKNIIVTVEGSTGTVVNIYVNGSNNTAAQGSVANVTGDSNGLIGARTSSNPGFFFNGKISNVSIWNYELNALQVREIYNKGLPSDLNTFSGTAPVAWWQLGENSSYVSGWTFADEIGSNNGTSGNLPETALTNGVGTTANGTSTGMSEGSLVGNAPYSTANAVSSGMSIVSRVSGVSDATITTGGTGYSTGTNIATTGGSGTNCTINITTVSGGAITAITINSGGNNYLIGDVLTVSGGNGNATITVSGLNTP